MKLIRTQDEEATGIDVAPLIDILFTLIIFFLVTTTFQEKEKEEEVRLPRQGGSSLVNKDRPFYINVLQDGTYSVGGEIVKLDDLELKLKLRFEEKPDQKLVLRVSIIIITSMNKNVTIDLNPNTTTNSIIDINSI